jgi:hypothetical protein
MGEIALGSMAGGTLLSSIGALQQGQQQSAMYDYQSELADVNADVSRQQAAQAAEAGELQDKAIGEKGAQVFGAGRASYGAGGVMLGTGSEADWEADVDQRISSDIAMNDYNTANKVWAYQQQANNYEAQADVYDMASSNASSSSWMNMGSSLLSGTGSTILGGYQLKKAGAISWK